MLYGKEFRKSSSSMFNSIDVSLLLMKTESLNDEVLLLRAGMTCQQTTAETLKCYC